MSYKTLMVHLQFGQSNKAVLDAARLLAETHQATVIGVAVAQKTQELHEEDYAIFGGLIKKYLPAVQARIEEAEAEFHAALQSIGAIEWRFGETYHSITDYLAEEARGADLVIVSADQPIKLTTQARVFDFADLVAIAGRPVLGVPKAPIKPAGFARGMICWKDSVETRRAVAGALPLLQKAAYVSLVRVASLSDLEAERERMELVTAWFKRHDVTVEPMVLDADGDDAARLRAAVYEQDPDFVIAGAYSHSRLRERVFGGVTRDLLRQIDRYVMLSH